MERLYVLGAGGLAREIALVVNAAGDDQYFGGYVDVSAPRGTQLTLGAVVGDDDWLATETSNARALIGVADPAIRLRLAARFGDLSALTFPNVVHPRAIVDSKLVSLGAGNVVMAGAVFTCDVAIGSHCVFHYNCTVSHDVVVGDGCVVNPSANVSGGVVLGSGVLIGAGAQVLQYRSVGEGATVGAGAVVTQDVPPGVVVAGVPARVIRGAR